MDKQKKQARASVSICGYEYVVQIACGLSLIGVDYTREDRPMFTSHDRAVYTTRRRPVFTSVA